MIVWACNLNLNMAERLVRGVSPPGVPQPPSGTHAAWVGMTNPWRSDRPLDRLTSNAPRLLLAFCDWDPDLRHRAEAEAGMTSAHPPTAEHAAALVAYLRRLHSAPERYALWAHCHGGVGRSGAVVQWAHETYGATWPTGTRAGRERAAPNAMLVRLLREADAVATLAAP